MNKKVTTKTKPNKKEIKVIYPPKLLEEKLLKEKQLEEKRLKETKKTIEKTGIDKNVKKQISKKISKITTKLNDIDSDDDSDSDIDSDSNDDSDIDDDIDIDDSDIDDSDSDSNKDINDNNDDNSNDDINDDNNDINDEDSNIDDINSNKDIDKKNNKEYPDVLNGKYKLFERQEKAIDWILERQNKVISGGILNLEPNFGKTLTILSMVSMNRFHTHETYSGYKKGESGFLINKPMYKYDYDDPNNGPTLIIVPFNLIQTWLDEISKYFGEKTMLKTLVYHHKYNSKSFLDNLTLKDIQQYDIILTTTNVCIKSDKKCQASKSLLVMGEKGILKDKIVRYTHETPHKIEKEYQKGITLIHHTKWFQVFVDEIHEITSIKTKKFLSVVSILSYSRFGLTGTMYKNSHKEFWCLYFFCKYDKMVSPKDFTYDRYDKSSLLNSLILQIKVKESEKSYPKPIYQTRYGYFNDDEQKIYDIYFSSLSDAYDAFVLSPSDTNWGSCLTSLCRLRQMCNSGHLIVSNQKSVLERSTNPDIQKLGTLLYDKNIMGFKSTKMIMLISQLENIILPNYKNKKDKNKKDKSENEPNRVIVFSYSSSFLRLAGEYLSQKYSGPEYKNLYRVIDGTTNSTRQKDILDYQNGKIDILLMNSTIGCLGLNLPITNYIISISPDWNQTKEIQGNCRALREGQKRVVTIIKLIIKGSIEEQITSICNAKVLNSMAYSEKDKSKLSKVPKLDSETLKVILEEGKKERKSVYLNTLIDLSKDPSNYLKYVPKDIITSISPYVILN